MTYANDADTRGGLTYTVSTFNQDYSLRTAARYDQFTGVGVPKASGETALVRTR